MKANSSSPFEWNFMHRPLSIAGMILGFAALQTSLIAGSLQKIKNEKVSVTEVSLAPGETEAFSDARASMIVYLSGKSVEVTPGRGMNSKAQVSHGETVFEPAGTRSLKNPGSSEMKFVRVEFLTPGKQETWGRTGLPPNYQILVENSYARAYDIKIAPHSFEQRHTHHDRIVICLSGATLEHLLPNGEKQPSTLKTGEIVWRPGATHVGHNMGSTPLWVICIEPK